MSAEYRRKLMIDRTLVDGDDLIDFPVLVVVTDPDLRHVDHGGRVRQPDAGDIDFWDSCGHSQLAHELVHYDPRAGRLEAWVRVDRLSASADTVLTLCIGDLSAPAPSDVWDEQYRLVIHDVGGLLRDSTRYHHKILRDDDEPSALHVASPGTLHCDEGLTVEAWVHDTHGRAEAMQALVSQWRCREEFTTDSFEAFDAGRTDGLDTTGFFGAVFDGRFIYFVPQHDMQSRHGKVLRYDTHHQFDDAASWSAFDAGNIDGLVTKGYYGAVHTGRYIYFCPRREPAGFHSRMLRYDTQGDFKEPGSWETHDLGLPHSCQSAAYDGRYIYFCPGQEARPRPPSDAVATDSSPKVTGMSADQLLVSSGVVIRHDTQSGFRDPRSWTTYDASGTDGLDTRDFDGAVFDGRYIYFMPLSYAVVLRYDTRGEFSSPASWSAFDARPLKMGRLVGGVFDGRHVYFVPYGECPVAVRYDTAADFIDPASWQALELDRIPRLPAIGYDGGFFDGRYIYYIPYWNEQTCFHGTALRFDTRGDFLDPGGWCWCDAGTADDLKTIGFNGGATDGRYLYFAPWNDGTGYPDRITGNGRVLRYDALKDGAFSLRYCDLGHNGGLCAGLPGARFIINTDHGPVSVAANRPPTPGWHHVAGVFDGSTARLYMDGMLRGEQPTTGKLTPSDGDLSIGRVLDGLGRFKGSIAEVRLSAVARNEAWLRATYRNLRDPESLCRLLPVSEDSSPRSVDRDDDDLLVLHEPLTRGANDLSAAARAIETRDPPEGHRSFTASSKPGLVLVDTLTVEAWVESDDPAPEALQVLVSQWSIPEEFGAFESFDAGKTDGLDATGFLGAIFDGRYVYFSPQRNTERLHGTVLRYDTHALFAAESSWAAYDAGLTDGLNTVGYYGAAFDGRYIYFVPRKDTEGYHSRVLRYDTQGPFKAAGSWRAYDVGLPISYQGAAFDGRYVYFAPGYDMDFETPSGKVLRYDSHGGFKESSSWRLFDAGNIGSLPTRTFDGAAFDGRHVLFVPLDHGCALAYDTAGGFNDAASWRACDLRPLGVKRCVGSVFDGRHWYLVPYGATRVVARWDTRRPFNSAASWEAFDAGMTSGLATVGYDGGAFDGRYVYFIPFWDGSDRPEGFHACFLRFDTTGPFDDPRSWSACDARSIGGLSTIGYNAGAFDGRYLYWAPWHDGAAYHDRQAICGHGRVVRYDTIGQSGSFSLRWSDYGHNGGLCAAVPGPSFIINTDRGPRSVRANRSLKPGRHQIVGVYDGRMIRLYVDGELAREQEASGRLVNPDVDISVGRLLNGLGEFRGTIHYVRISRVARDAAWIATSFRNLADPALFRSLVPPTALREA